MTDLADRPARATGTAPAPRRARRHPVREAITSLTVRGHALIATGALAVGAGWALAETDLVRVGTVVMAAPLVSVVWLLRADHRLDVERSVRGGPVSVGQVIRTELGIRNAGSATGNILAEDQVPRSFGRAPRFVIDSMAAGSRRRLVYRLRPRLRGRHHLGPLRIVAGDPFGIARREHHPGPRTEVIVLPATEPLPRISLTGAWNGAGENKPRPFSTGGVADATIREYRHGDDLRRVHWPTTARTGELMVRREEQPWQAHATILVDNRSRAHRGSGPDSSIERTVSVAASIARHLADQHFEVRVVAAGSDRRPADEAGRIDTTAAHALEQLAVLETSGATGLRTDGLDDSAIGGLLIAVLGAVSPEDLAALRRGPYSGGVALAILAAVDDWAGAAPSTSVNSPWESARWLRRHGWSAEVLGRGGSLPAAWEGLQR